jgi:hypothetical protein
MKIDGVECEEGDRVLFRSTPTRWQRVVAWLRRLIGRPEPQPCNTVWEVANGSWAVEIGAEQRREPIWLRGDRWFNRMLVWCLAACGNHSFGLNYGYDDDDDDC